MGLFDIITAILLALVGALGGMAFQRNRDRRKMPPPIIDILKAEITDEQAIEIRRQIKEQLDLAEKVRQGGDPDEILADHERRVTELERRLDQLR